MQTYHVKITRYLSQTFTIRVTADDEAGAVEKAEATAERSTDAEMLSSDPFVIDDDDWSERILERYEFGPPERVADRRDDEDDDLLAGWPPSPRA